MSPTKRKNGSCKTLLSLLWWKSCDFTRFSPSFGNSSGIGNSPSFHSVVRRFSDSTPSLGNQSGGFRITSSFHCSDGRYLIWKKHQHHLKMKTQEAVCTLSWPHKALLWHETQIVHIPVRPLPGHHLKQSFTWRRASTLDSKQGACGTAQPVVQSLWTVTNPNLIVNVGSFH